MKHVYFGKKKMSYYGIILSILVISVLGVAFNSYSAKENEKGLRTKDGRKLIIGCANIEVVQDKDSVQVFFKAKPGLGAAGGERSSTCELSSAGEFCAGGCEGTDNFATCNLKVSPCPERPNCTNYQCKCEDMDIVNTLEKKRNQQAVSELFDLIFWRNN